MGIRFDLHTFARIDFVPGLDPFLAVNDASKNKDDAFNSGLPR